MIVAPSYMRENEAGTACQTPYPGCELRVCQGEMLNPHHTPRSSHGWRSTPHPILCHPSETRIALQAPRAALGHPTSLPFLTAPHKPLLQPPQT